ncbi:MAG: dTDP-glucose 4,6-dehydratase [Patescibacteria group bacterium]|nr:dTDP-glucose 4,6-dehydratase [Patescibacteria group bacterium]
MRLLVTGGAGFIGSNFIRYWLTTHPDDQVINFDALTYAGNLENLRDIEDNPNYEFVKGNICDRDAVDAVMSRVDTVVHFAAESHVDRSISDPMPFIKTNVEGTFVLLESALKHSISRFHHISTDEVFGALPLDSKRKFTDDTKYDPHSPYSASKAASDHLVRAYHDTYGLPVTISNCSNNFGPYHFPEKLIPLAITNILEGKKVPVYGDGLYVRDWLYVKDHCTAIDAILTNGKIGRTYLVGGLTEDIPNIEVIRRILRIMGKGEEMIEYVKDRPGHDRRYAIDWTTIKRELNWKPAYSFDQALQETIHWFESNRQWWERIKSGAYREYYQNQYSVTE